MSSTKQMEDAIFFTAVSMTDAEERRRFLDQACARNAGLRAVVEEMLAASDEADPFFSKGRSALVLPPEEISAVAGDVDEARANAEADEYIGRNVGRYKLLQRIGEGGCGVVYMAEQEEPVRRRVALKIIKLGMDTKSVIARFDAERQALALMDHPNIARVLDAGATETGRPFFVMELVRGFKITDYCDQDNLDTEQRLHLFIQVCNAIQHAHQKGIIHRDIKPSNILVTMHDGRPVPKVIDFGIAKAIEGRLTEQTLFTAYEQLIGTPAYMSPEQAEMSGLDVDTRSDIYSLGVLLYELLTGKTPFNQKDLMASGLDEMRRKLREDEPQRPSTILTTLHGTELRVTAEHRHSEPPRLVSLVKGDLDWIVMKSLEKDRKRRYETANGLAMDVQRYLNNEPVVARPPSRLYRLQKLVRRNRVVFGAGTAVALALVAGLGASTWLFFKAEEARTNEAKLRRQAEAREKLTEAVMLVTQEKYEDAARILEAMKVPPTRPSLDGVSALRSVGEWLAIQGRWGEAARRFSALMEIDKLDPWGPVTLDYQSCGVVLVESGNREGFERFREEAVARFMTETNGDAAGRILKTCLLPPVNERALAQVQPLGLIVEKWTDAQVLATRAGWAAIPVALWKYRSGEFAKAEEYCRLALDPKDRSPKTATVQLILAMTCFRSGQETEARKYLAEGRVAVERRFEAGLDRGMSGIGMWYDWLFARVLLREADGLIQPEDGSVTN
jgi:eukaryotic-like serine/threonine-protein kinase